MDVLSQHEAFLRAIFDAPDDDTPRLVYADFLQENGEEVRAELIRVQCELAMWDRNGGAERDRLIELHLRQTEVARRCGWNAEECDRGFERLDTTAKLHADSLKKPRKLRLELVSNWPGYFAARAFAVAGGRLQTESQINTLFTLAAFSRITVLRLQGFELEPGNLASSLPVITAPAVEAISRQPSAARLVGLILTGNNLLDETAQSLVDSPYLDNLKELCFGGNAISTAMWQRLVNRFGASVVRRLPHRGLRY